MSFLDRSNIGNAKLYSMEKDLKLKGLMYNVSENHSISAEKLT
jgi:hypothetical protein